MADRRWRVAIAVLAMLGGTALVLDWIEQDPSRRQPPLDQAQQRAAGVFGDPRQEPVGEDVVEGLGIGV